MTDVADITSVNDLTDFFPTGSLKYSTRRELHGPCPYCPEDSTSTYIQVKDRRIAFTGDDRLVVFVETGGQWCRHCAARGDGRHGRGYYSLKDLMIRLGLSAAEHLEHEAQTIEDTPLHMLWLDQQVNAAHAAVDRLYWKDKCGWNDEIIDHFRLGKGILYQRMGEGHIIPMKVRKPGEEPLEAWYISCRKDGRKERSPGSSKPYFWLIHEDPQSDLVAVNEGEKDIPTSWAIGYRNATAAFGVNHWTLAKVEELWKLGFRRMDVFGDNDEEGEAFARKVAGWGTRSKMAVRIMIWDKEFKPKGDPTDKLAEMNGDIPGLRQYVDTHLQPFTEDVSAGITRSTRTDGLIDPADESRLITREEIRGDGPNSMLGTVRDFLKTYAEDRQYGRGKTLLVSPGPGAGKTKVLVQVVEQLATQYLQRREREKQTLIKELSEMQTQLDSPDLLEGEERELLRKKIQRSQIRLEEWSVAGVAWFGQYIGQWEDLQNMQIDPDLWYNFVARNQENCDNLPVVLELGSKFHDVMAFCRTGCPMREHCKKHGYLAQESQRASRPITFFRHEHMRSDMRLDYHQLIVIDENPSSVWEATPVKFEAKDVYPFQDGWETDYEDSPAYSALMSLTDAVRAAMSFNVGQYPKTPDGQRNPDYRVSGSRLFRLIDDQLQAQGMSLTTVLDEISDDMVKAYQPTYLHSLSGTPSGIKARPVPYLIKGLLRELELYRMQPHHEQVGTIHLIGGEMQVYPAEAVKFSSATPLIIADGTALPLLYEAMFDRPVQIYAPDFRNENCTTTTITGSDWTKGQFTAQLGKFITHRERQISKLKLSLAPGEELNIDDIPYEEDVYDSSMAANAMSLIKGLSERHQSLLVVTHKPFRSILETTLMKTYPALKERVSWGHYGALRGTNKFEELQAVLLIGAFRIPYDLAYLYISMWAWMLKIHDPISDELVLKSMAYHGQGGQGHGYRTFEHPFADAYVNALETAEMDQCAARIRPHASELPKWVYYAASRPSGKWITQLIERSFLVNQLTASKVSEVYKLMREHYEKTASLLGKGKFPPYRPIAQKFNVSNREIGKIREQIEMELGIAASS